MVVRQPKEVVSIMGVVDTFLRHRQEETKGDRSYKHYHPSEFGKCLRTQQYKHYVELGYIEMAGEEESFSSQKIRLFDKGHNMHLRWQRDYFASMGVLRGIWKCLNPFCFSWQDDGTQRWEGGPTVDQKKQMIDEGKTRVYGKEAKIGVFKPEACKCGCTEFEYHEITVVDEDLNMIGHADLVLDFSRLDEKSFNGVRKSFALDELPKEPIVADMKTINDWQFKGKVLKHGPHKEYQIQIAIYAYILGLKYGLIIYENKNDSTAAAYKVDMTPEVIETVKFQAKAMKKMAPLKLLPPPRPDDKSSSECKYCDFRSICHASSIWKDPEIDKKRNAFYKNLI